MTYLFYLKEMRVKSGTTQQQLADYLGVSRPTYTRYEIGDRMPAIDTLIKMADFFGITLDALVKSSTADSLYQQISSRVRELSESDKQNLLRYLDFMQKRTSLSPDES